MEPRASAPHRRLDAIRALADAGVPAGVMTAPMIPGLNDHEMEAILEAATEAGATRAASPFCACRSRSRSCSTNGCAAHRPDRAERVLSLIRQMRGGALYQAEFGLRMRARGRSPQLLSARFGSGGEAARASTGSATGSTRRRFHVPESGTHRALVDARRDARQMKLL